MTLTPTELALKTARDSRAVIALSEGALQQLGLDTAQNCPHVDNQPIVEIAATLVATDRRLVGFGPA